jgi:hypothetical protein
LGEAAPAVLYLLEGFFLALLVWAVRCARRLRRTAPPLEYYIVSMFPFLVCCIGVCIRIAVFYRDLPVQVNANPEFGLSPTAALFSSAFSLLAAGAIVTFFWLMIGLILSFIHHRLRRSSAARDTSTTP